MALTRDDVQEIKELPRANPDIRDELRQVILGADFERMPESLEALTRRLDAGTEEMLRRLGEHDKRFDAHDERFDQIDKRFDEHDKRFDRVELRLDGVETRLGNVETRLGNVETSVNKLAGRFGNFEGSDLERRYRQNFGSWLRKLVSHPRASRRAT